MILSNQLSVILLHQIGVFVGMGMDYEINTSYINTHIKRSKPIQIPKLSKRIWKGWSKNKEIEKYLYKENSEECQFEMEIC